MAIHCPGENAEFLNTKGGIGMNWKVLDALETKHSAVNGIMVVEIANHSVVMANSLALQYFAGRNDVISLQKTLGRETNLDELFQSVEDDLGENLVTVMEDAVLEGKTGEELDCNISFTYANPDKKHFFVKVRPNIDNRPYFLGKFIESRKHPAFSLNLNANLTINHGNELFYRAFACNKTSMKLRYKNYFGNLLAEDLRQDYEGKIHAAVEESPMGKLEIPVQTAQGETLYFYYDSRRLRQVESDYRNNLFCLLVGKDAKHADLCKALDKVAF